MRSRTTIITGSRSGMGQAVARLLQTRGETVIGIDLADAEIIADLATVDGRKGAVEQLAGRVADGVDALITCAGVLSDDGGRVISVNYFGTVDLVLGVMPMLAGAVSPRVVCICSTAAMLPMDPVLVTLCLNHDEPRARQRAAGNLLAYTSSKHALTRWVRRNAVLPAWAGSGLLLNGVAPGLVMTPMTQPMLATAEGRDALAKGAPYATAEPAGPEDVAPLIAFMASADNRYMVGQVPYCDGGKDVLMRGDGVH